MFKYLNIALVLIILSCGPPRDPQLSITISRDPDYTTGDGVPRPVVTLENSAFRAVIATKEGGTCGIESGLLEWTHKSTGTNQVPDGGIIDADYMRGPVRSAEITDDRIRMKRVVLEYEDLPDQTDRGDETDNHAVLAYTIFPNSPVIHIGYLDRTPMPDPIVDLGAPGGVRRIGGGFSENASTSVYGQEDYHDGELVCHPKTYWTNVNDDPRAAWGAEPADGGPLNYNSHLIVAVASNESGEGYGRMVPIHLEGTQGGACHLKLLWNTGIEFYTKPWTDSEFGRSSEVQSYNPSYTAYIYCFDAGLERAMRMGQSIADGDINELNLLR